MYPLNEAQIKILRDNGWEQLVISNRYILFPSLATLKPEDVSKLMGLVGISGDYGTLRNNGLMADWAGFSQFLKTSAVFVAAVKAGQSSPTIRKLVFELVFWVGHEMSSASPNTVLACWQELITVTKGGIKASVPASDIDAWNKAVDDFRLSASFKL